MAKDPVLGQKMFLLIEQFKESRLSIKEFCEQNNIRYHSFHYWYKRYKQKDNREVAVPLFKPINVHPGTTSNISLFAEVTFPSGCQIRFSNSVSTDYLKALIS